MDRVDEIVKGKHSDIVFLSKIQDLEDEDLEYVLEDITEIHAAAKGKITTAVGQFRETGIAADPEWFSKCKTVVNIRKKHILMIEREIRIRERGNQETKGEH